MYILKFLNPSEQAAFRSAIQGSNNELVHEMISKNRDLKNYVLHIAAGLGNIEILRHYILAGVDVNKIATKVCTDFTPLQKAVSSNQYQAVKFLVEAGANFNGTFSKTCLEKCSIINMAISNRSDDLDILEFLLGQNANPNQSCDTCYPPLVKAISERREKTVEVLLEYGANVNLMCSDYGDEITPLHMAVKYNQLGIIEQLLSKNAEINAVTSIRRESVLHSGIRVFVGPTVVKYVLSAGLDLNIVDSNNQTALEMHRIRYAPKSAEVIKEHLVKLKAAGFHLIERNLEVIDNPEFDQLLTSCCEEIKLMKNCRIAHTRVTFDDLLRTNEHTIALRIKCVKEENVLDYRKKFPLYSDIIDYKLKRVLIRQNRLVKVNSFLEDIFWNLFPATIVINISVYFSELYVEELNKKL